MHNNHGFDQPVTYDTNTAVGDFPWEGSFGKADSMDTTNMSVMTDSSTQMVAPERDATGEAHVAQQADPEGAGEGQALEGGGDSEGQDWGQDTGSEDVMKAETINLPLVGSVSVVALGVVALAGWWWWSRSQ